MSKKGVSLPVNVLVVLAIAIVVLLGVIAFFSGSLGGTGEKVSAQSELKTCCITYRQAGCPQETGQGNAFDCPGGTSIDTLLTKVGVGSSDDSLTGNEYSYLKSFCNCP